MDEDRNGVAALLAPVTIEEFFARHWERAPLHVPANGAPRLPGFGLDGLDALLATTKLDPTDVRVYRAGDDVHTDYTYRAEHVSGDNARRHGPASRLDVGRLYELFEAGATIALNQLSDYCEPVAVVCRSLRRLLRCKGVSANAYLAPPRAVGWGAHYDLDDVFVVQCDGSKRWRVWAGPRELPYRGQMFVKGRDPLGEPVLDVVLQPGDLLYLPRGFVHEPVTEDAHSLHVTLVTFVHTWADLVDALVGAAGDADVALRRGLPLQDPARGASLEDLRAELRGLLARLDDETALRRALAGLLGGHRDDGAERGRLARAVARGRLDAASVVRATGRPARVAADGARLSVSYGESLLQLPRAAQPEVEALLASPGVRIADLPGRLDAAGRVALVRRLIGEGLVEVA
ncbi:MAG: hypothetical protein IPM29_15950 [Planctomycetes bacterium]|nr:hypothetical protein [Planctomycetota bacterium]